jgi:hypothetical protein
MRRRAAGAQFPSSFDAGGRAFVHRRAVEGSCHLAMRDSRESHATCCGAITGEIERRAMAIAEDSRASAGWALTKALSECGI